MTTAAPPPLVAVSPTTVISAPVPKSKMSKSLTFHDIMLGQVTTAYAGEAADDVNGDEVVDDSIVVECVEEGYINGRVPASIIMMPNGKKMTMMNNCVHHTNHHHHHHHSLPLIGNQNSVENASHRNIDTKNKYIDTTNAPKQCDSARNHCNYYPPGGGIQPTAMSSNCIEPPVKCSNHVKFAQSGSCSIASPTRPPCGENASEGWVTTAGKKSTVIATTANNKNKQKLKSAVRTAASVDEALSSAMTRSGGGDARASKNDAEVATTTAARIFSSMKKKPTLKTSVSEMCDIGAPSMSSSGMKRTTTLIIPKDEPSTASTTNDHNHSSISEDEFADDDESDDTLSAVAVTKGRVGSTRSSSSGVNRRGLPFNVPFSTWLQLFLQRRRSRNAHSSAGVASRYPPASLMRNSVSLSVVHESSALGSDGESLEVSPCTSDQMSTSSLYPNGNDERCYVPNVKMRQKPQNRQWSEQDIQKRLSLPADIKLPQTVIDKLNRTPTLNNPLTRKSRRASLSEIGFGKLETYKKFFNLGEGTYATVYFGKSLLTGKSVALKEIRLEHEEGAPCTAIREVSLLRNLRHANVVTLHDVIYTERVLTLVFEYVQYDLREYMEKVDEIYVNNVKLFLMQLLRGLAYCHKRRILHRDLKPQNLLINHCGELKLADFGLARAQSVPTKTYSNEVVTLWYRPPDVLLGSTDYSTHIDMWGVGCILYEMLMHKAMFPGCTTDDQLNLIFRRLGTPTRETCPALFELTQAYRLKGYARFSAKSLVHPPRINADRADLLQKLLRYDGTKRISAEEAMRHKILDFFPSTIFSLADTESVLSLPKIYYVREQSWKSGGYMRSMLDK